MQFDLLRQLISCRLGLQVREQDLLRLQDAMAARYRLLQLPGLDEYVVFLQRKSRESDREWEQLATVLTTGETFFFRDRGQTEVLHRNNQRP